MGTILHLLGWVIKPILLCHLSGKPGSDSVQIQNLTSWHLHMLLSIAVHQAGETFLISEYWRSLTIFIVCLSLFVSSHINNLKFMHLGVASSCLWWKLNTRATWRATFESTDTSSVSVQTGEVINKKAVARVSSKDWAHQKVRISKLIN